MIIDLQSFAYGDQVWVNEHIAENCRPNLPSFTFIQTTWVRISPFIFIDALHANI